MSQIKIDPLIEGFQAGFSAAVFHHHHREPGLDLEHLVDQRILFLPGPAEIQNHQVVVMDFEFLNQFIGGRRLHGILPFRHKIGHSLAQILRSDDQDSGRGSLNKRTVNLTHAKIVSRSCHGTPSGLEK